MVLLHTSPQTCTHLFGVIFPFPPDIYRRLRDVPGIELDFFTYFGFQKRFKHLAVDYCIISRTFNIEIRVFNTIFRTF